VEEMSFIQKVFISGATGFIGSKLAIKLAGRGAIVHALYRSKEKARILSHSNIRLFRGDITDLGSIREAMSGCRQVYHVAALADIWAKNPNAMYQSNVTGTENVIRAALEMGIEKIVHTSTAGVFSPFGDCVIDENCPTGPSHFMEYDQSKAVAEAYVLKMAGQGANIVVVNPTRVFGPGLMTRSNNVTALMKRYREGKWRFAPGNGKSIGNYAFIEDVVLGHIAAMEKGKAGERYILGGENISYNDFFGLCGEISGKKRALIKVPLFLILGISNMAVFFARTVGLRPAIAPQLVRKIHQSWEVSSAKAVTEIGYQITPFETAVKITFDWLKTIKN
jgi:nucleoside-diphosphate-sugar epimerase